MPRCSRCSFYGKPWRQSLASSQCGSSSPGCEMMAKTVVSAVKPGGQTMRPVRRAFLLAQQQILASAGWLGERVCSPVAHIYRDNGAVLHGVPVAPGDAVHQLTCLRPPTWSACARSFPGMCGQDRGVVFCWNPVKIALSPAGAHCLSPPRPACQSSLCGPRHPLDPCFLFFLAAKCPTHLK